MGDGLIRICSKKKTAGTQEGEHLSQVLAPQGLGVSEDSLSPEKGQEQGQQCGRALGSVH